MALQCMDNQFKPESRLPSDNVSQSKLKASASKALLAAHDQESNLYLSRSGSETV